MTPSTSVSMRSLSGYEGLPRDYRELRYLLEAVALGRKEPSPGLEVPKAWLPQLHLVASSRASHASWREAFLQAGLELPDGVRVSERVEAELHELWEGLPALVARVKATSHPFLRDRLMQTLQELLE